MITVGALERPGIWRGAGLGLALGLAAAPAVVLVWPAVADLSRIGETPGAAFCEALARSLGVACGAGSIALVIGLAAGLTGALFSFPGRRVLLAAIGMPLLVPSFLWAIGLSMLRAQAGLARDGVLSGGSGCVIAFSALGIPLVTYMTFAAARAISRSQIDAARLAGGDWAIVSYAARNVFPASALAAVLAGVLTLSDPGPGQILGYPGAATEVLVSFSALYDHELAARQCLALGGLVLAIAGPVAWWGAGTLSEPLIARDAEPASPRSSRAASVAGPVLFAGIILITVVLPLSGLIWPAIQRPVIGPALRVIQRTAADTVIYAASAAVIAVLLGVFLAVCAGRQRRLRRVLLAGLLILLALPPSLSALGAARAASFAPEALDVVFRSRATVGWVLALRFLPVAALLFLRSLSSTSVSWVWAAAIHGVGLAQYLRRVLCPLLLPAGVVAALLVSLFATAEVGTVLLLQPPGRASLPVAIFTVMANAPESLVATLCLFYVLGSAMLLGSAWLILLHRSTSKNRGSL